MSFKLIGEIGVNHNGDVAIAKELITFLSNAGADFAKIQLFTPELLVKSNARLATYQRMNGVKTESQFEMLSNLTLTRQEVMELSEHASLEGIELIATPFDVESMTFLTSQLGHRYLKFSSGDLTFSRLLWEASRTAAHMFVSTGMSNMAEIDASVKVIRFGRAQRRGLIPAEEIPSSANLGRFEENLESVKIEELGLTLFHCTSSYPAPNDELNISALNEMSSFGCELGYSDHSLGDVGAVMALALGARVFEKHVTLDVGMSGPDHAASLSPGDFKRYKASLEEAFGALGDGKKVPQVCESDVIEVARRGLYASAPIRLGETFTKDNLLELRPRSGISSNLVFDVLGNEASQEFAAGDAIG
jgi:sialic acid synthase SpsE